jgi:NADH dehydrogenase
MVSDRIALSAVGLPWLDQLGQGYRQLANATHALDPQHRPYPLHFGTAVAIIGGGIGGMTAAKELGRNKNIKVTLVNPTDDFLYQPLYSYNRLGFVRKFSLKQILGKLKNIRIINDYATQVNYNNNLHKGTLRLGKSQAIPFDHLIVATGSRSCHSDGKLHYHTPSDIKKIRTALISCLNQAYKHYLENPENTDLEKEMSIRLLGAGISSVELAFQIKQLSDLLIEELYPKFKEHRPTITIYDDHSVFLEKLHPKVRKVIIQALQSEGIHIRTNYQQLSSAAELSSGMTVYIGGTEANVSEELLPGVPITRVDKKNRLLVNKRLEVQPGLYAIGDAAAVFDNNIGYIQKTSGQLSVQHAKAISRIIQAQIAGKPIKADFIFREYGHCISLGQNNALISYTGLPRPFDCILIKGRLAAWIKNIYYTFLTG